MERINLYLTLVNIFQKLLLLMLQRNKSYQVRKLSSFSLDDWRQTKMLKLKSLPYLAQFKQFPNAAITVNLKIKKKC